MLFFGSKFLTSFQCMLISHFKTNHPLRALKIRVKSPREYLKAYCSFILYFFIMIASQLNNLIVVTLNSYYIHSSQGEYQQPELSAPRQNAARPWRLPRLYKGIWSRIHQWDVPSCGWGFAAKNLYLQKYVFYYVNLWKHSSCDLVF